ncbi:hypothetical protein ABZX95_20170 [Streptomyces sp. NPDC004232]|uniref:hypothetical protein n=1 Tax=Streptomyces sp. NPDC004232 TaxID=3154454 RepID=UPI001DAE44A7|nr:hypothetical protein [Streptomyces sp. tea 10]
MKLSSVLSDITGADGRAILGTLMNGVCDPGTLAELAVRRGRSKVPALINALYGQVTDHHAFMCRHYLEKTDRLTSAADRIDARITALLARLGHDQNVADLDTIPASAPQPPRSSSPRPAVTWRSSPPPGTSPAGSRSVRG